MYLHTSAIFKDEQSPLGVQVIAGLGVVVKNRNVILASGDLKSFMEARARISGYSCFTSQGALGTLASVRCLEEYGRSETDMLCFDWSLTVFPAYLLLNQI